MSDQTDMAASLTDAVERILKTANSTPTKLSATFVYTAGETYEELVPEIQIEWAKPRPCENCGRFDNENCPKHLPLR